MAHGGHGGGGGPLKEFFLALGLDADAASFASAHLLVEGLEKGLELAFEAAKELTEAFVENIHETIEWGEELKIASEALGISTTQLQELNYVARLSNVSADEMRMGWQRLSRTMGAARDGNVEAAQAFAKLGVRVTDGAGHLRSLDDVTGDLAEGISKLPPGAERTAAAMTFFGRSGGRLVPILSKGRDGVREMREEAQLLGGVMGEEQVEAAARAGESLKKLGFVTESVRREFAGPFIDALNPILEAVIEWVKANRQLISERVKEWAERLASTLRYLGEHLGTIIEAVGFVLDNWRLWLVLAGSLVAAMALLGATSVAAALASAAAWLISIAPLLLVAAGIALLVLAVDDFLTFMRGGESVIGHVLEGWAREFLKFFGILDRFLPPEVKQILKLTFGEDLEKTARGLGIPVDLVKQGMGVAFGQPAALAGAQPVVPVAGGSSRVHAPSTTHITIHAPAGANPKEIADEVDKRIKEHDAARLRETYNQVPGS